MPGCLAVHVLTRPDFEYIAVGLLSDNIVALHRTRVVCDRGRLEAARTFSVCCSRGPGGWPERGRPAPCAPEVFHIQVWRGELVLAGFASAMGLAR